MTLCAYRYEKSLINLKDYVPKPNRGSAVPDTIAVGKGSETLENWKKREDIKQDGQIRLVRLVHMRYQHPDLNVITRFLQGE